MIRFSNLTPEEAWLAVEPTNEEPFDRRAAAHLYRRAGFGANTRELDEAVRSGPQAAVKRLLTGGEDAAFADEARKLAQVALLTNDPKLLTAWWLHRMRHTPAPLVEKMTLFWHGHFATSAEKVRDAPLMFEQNELLRRHALGDFGELVREISRDPAMLIYLDSDTNRKNHPNENFAREVMELFCLGVDRYSERDIQELARCFTGREIQYGKFKFNANQHDEGSKTVLGKSGRFDGDQGLAVILQQPAAAEFVCGKLVQFFVTDEPETPAEYIASLARQFRENGLIIRPVVETILTSRLFYSPAMRGARIRSPVELGVGLMRALETVGNMRNLATQLGELGQMPFFPPNVKGWSGGRTWIDSSTLLGRVNLVRAITQSQLTRFGDVTLAEYVERLGLRSNVECVDWLSELLVAAPLEAEVRGQLIERLEMDRARHPGALARVIHVLGSLPEFQLA
jgi:uncharacterized protein (DUF1800 family)